MVWISLGIGLLAWQFADCPAQTVSAARQRHPWGRFEPGAWKLVRVVTETLDDTGKVVSNSTTETRTTLRSVDAQGITLAVEMVVEIGGRRLDGEPQIIRQGFHGETPGQPVALADAGTAVVTIDGRDYPCQIEQATITAASFKTVTRAFCSASVAPYALRLESATTDLQSGSQISRTQWQVASLDAPCRLFRGIRHAAQVKSVLEHAKGTTTTVALTSIDVPGGVVCHTAEELDASGRLMRRSTLELVAFGTEPEGRRMGPMRRIRSLHRHRIPARPS